MTQKERHDGADDLIEPQGVNAAPPVGEALAGTEHAGEKTPTAPDEIDLLNAGPDRMAGLPEQRPGYPGQQRSVDTS